MRSATRKICMMTMELTGLLGAANCEIPCGIYRDRMRIDLLREHGDTIETSMREIKALRSASGENVNQLVRWIVNKEDHANKVQDIVCRYFMNQRVTPVEKSDAEAYERYVEQITLLHRMLVVSMKCKQTADETHVEKLRTLLDSFVNVYFTEEERQHSH